MKIEQITITPDVAAIMLQRNTHNRPMNAGHVRTLMREMQAGRWVENGDTICFSQNALVDGQHRLEAIRRSGCTIRAIVVSDVGESTLPTKDAGRRRNAADALHLRGEKNCVKMASSLALIERYKTNRMTYWESFTNTEVCALVEKYPDVRESIRICAINNKRIMQMSIMVAGHYLFAEKCRPRADEFVKQICDGVGLESDMPVYLFRERMLQNATSKSKLGAFYVFALLVKAWNAERMNIRMRTLKFAKGEQFPQVV
jgi:hypothetical protein